MKPLTLLPLALALSAALAHGQVSSQITTTGTATRSPNGVVDWNADHLWQGPHGVTRASTTTGQSRRTEDGREWTSTTIGPNGRTLTRQGTSIRTPNCDGTVTITREWTGMTDTGKILSGSSESIVTKTKNGRTWETTGVRRGPRGETTFTGSGFSHRTATGSVWNASRQGIGPEGREWKSQTHGSSTRTETGSEWTAKTTRVILKGNPDGDRANRGNKTGRIKNAAHRPASP